VTPSIVLFLGLVRGLDVASLGEVLRWLRRSLP
jgi:hypothetical protein